MTAWPITVDQAAERLHVSPRKLRDLLKDYPFFRRAGRRILFTRGDFTRLTEALPCPSDFTHLVPAARKTGGFAGHTSGFQLIEARELLKKTSPKRCAERSSGTSKVVSLSQARTSQRPS